MPFWNSLLNNNEFNLHQSSSIRSLSAHQLNTVFIPTNSLPHPMRPPSTPLSPSLSLSLSLSLIVYISSYSLFSPSSLFLVISFVSPPKAVALLRSDSLKLLLFMWLSKISADWWVRLQRRLMSYRDPSSFSSSISWLGWCCRKAIFLQL